MKKPIRLRGTKPARWIADHAAQLETAACLLFGCGCVLLLFRFFSVPFQPAVFALSCAAAVLGLRAALRCRRVRTWAVCGVFGALFSAAVVAGRRIDVENVAFLGFSAPDLVYWLCFAVFCAAMAAAVSAWLCAHPIAAARAPAEESVFSRVMSWASWTAILTVCYLFYYFVFFPGLMTGDSFACYVRAAGIAPISNQQPVVYQLVMAVFLALGDLFGDVNAGIAFFTLFQLLCMASAFGYSLSWMRRRGLPRPVVWLLVLWFGVNPLHGMYAVTVWKDVPFGAAVLLFMLFLFDTARAGGRNLLRWQGMVHLAVLGLAVSFLRNNGIYLLACALLVAGVQLRAHWKRLVPCFLALLVVIWGVQGPLYSALGIAQSPFAESLAIPLQQMGRVVSRGGELTEEQAEYLDHLLPLETMGEVYWDFSADRIKFHEDFDDAFLEANKGGFFSTWLTMLFPHFKDYCIAFLMETAGYWRPGTMNWYVAPGINGYSTTYGVEPANLAERYLGLSLQETIQEKAEDLQEDDLTAPFFNMAAMVWLVFFCAALLLARGQGRRLLFLVPLLALWATTMIAAPTFCELRYLYAFFTCAPAAVWLSLPGREESLAAPRARNGAGEKTGG